VRERDEHRLELRRRDIDAPLEQVTEERAVARGVARSTAGPATAVRDGARAAPGDGSAGVAGAAQAVGSGAAIVKLPPGPVDFTKLDTVT
jgi:hypothetical protein